MRETNKNKGLYLDDPKPSEQEKLEKLQALFEAALSHIPDVKKRLELINMWLAIKSEV